MVDVGGPQTSTLRANAVASPTKLLQVDVASGGFFFQNLGELWTKPEMSRTLPATDRDAAAATRSFMAQHEGLPGGYYGYGYGQHVVTTPTIQLEGATNGPMTTTTTIAATTPTSPTNYAIDYARTLDIGDGQQLSVVGPGSRLNVYIGDNSQVVGLQGGWRSVMPVPRLRRPSRRRRP